MATTNQQARLEASANGQIRFMPVKPCKRGHLTERRVDNSCCCECMRITARVRSRNQPRKGQRGDQVWRDAVARGDKTYSTGKPCRRGHIAERYVIGRGCLACVPVLKERVAVKQKRQRRLEGKRETGIRLKAIERGESHYFTGRLCKRGHLDWRNVKSLTCLACSREKTKAFHRDNPEYHRLWNRVRSKRVKQATPSWVDLQELKKLYINCPEGYHVDHIVPLRHHQVCGLHVMANLRYLPAIANIRKSNKFVPQIGAETYGF